MGVDWCEGRWGAGSVGWCVGWLVPPSPTTHHPTTNSLMPSDARQHKIFAWWMGGRGDGGRTIIFLACLSHLAIVATHRFRDGAPGGGGGVQIMPINVFLDHFTN